MRATKATTTTTTTTARERDGATGHDRPGARTRGGFLLLGGVQMTLIFTLASLAVPLPRIGADFRLDRADLILLSAAYGLTFAGLLLLGGRLADRFGGRRTLTAGLLVFGTASALAPLAPGYEALLAARFGQGVGAALVAPAAMAVLRALFPAPAAYGRAMATWGGLSVLGATAGNLLSGVIAAASSWRGTFAVPVAVTLAALLLAPRLLPATPPGTDRALDLPGALLATAGITLASFGLVLTDAHSWGSAPVLVPLLTGLALLAAFAVVERRTADPLLPPDFLRDGRRGLGLAAIGLTAAGTATVFILLSLALQEGRGWSALLTSAAFVPFAVALLGAGRLAGPLIGRYGPGRVTGAGLGTAAAGLGLLAATGFDGSVPYAYGLLPGLLLLPAGGALSFAGAAVLATEGVPAHRAGLAGGVLNTAMELGPTVLFAALLTLGGDAVSLAAAAVLFTALAATTIRTT
ncbi:MFS transporter permease [Streptomyces sp. Root431]|uniref:MFS transporter n=1 Tax=Streptomyces sp. Root431 TaxID=1736535 RepID=UPI0006FACC62|nr:MFS transporter [Streptomyces sp. Root431]KQX16932.1 MFS transporter permease [Streptomyces sp. Root431]